MRRLLALFAAPLAAAVLLSGCSGGGDGAAAGDGSVVRVFAAASLTDVFDDLAASFEAAHPDVDVQQQYGGSAELAQQLVNGAPGHVFAAASTKTMATVGDAKLLGAEPVVFARNRPVLVVPKGNPAGVTGVADLGRDELKIAVCAPEVPCGAAALQLAQSQGVAVKPDTEESNVRSVLTKVALGEVDLGVVYVTDAATSTEVEQLETPREGLATYVIAPLKDASPRAAEWIAYVTGEPGRDALAAAGFELP